MRINTHVRPLSVCLPPILGESLNGFVSRSFALSPIRERSTALRLAGLEHTDIDLRRSLESGKQAANLGTKLGCPPELLILMSLPCRSTFSSFSQRSFFGTWFDRNVLDVQRRWVSPRALSNRSFHRSTWMLRMFQLDGMTLEPLIDTCPVCGIKLGWRRAVRAHYCDNCLDSDGRPNVDLRSFARPPHDLKDPDGYRFLHDLIDPAALHRRPRSNDPRWSSLRPTTLFELGYLLAKLLGGTELLGGLSERSMKQFLPESVAHAGRCVMEGVAGIEAVEEVLSQRYGRPVLLDAIGANSQVSASVRLLVESVFGPPPRATRQYHPLRYVRSHHRITDAALQRFLTKGVTVGERRKVRYHAESLDRLAPEFHDVVETSRAVAILGILPRDIITLVRLTLLERPSQQVQSLLLGHGDIVRASGVSQLLGNLDDRATEYDCNVTSLREFHRTRCYPCTLGIVLAAAQSSEVSLSRLHSQSACWADAFGVVNEKILEQRCLAIIAEYPQAVRAVAIAS